MSTFVREFVDQISRFACSAECTKIAHRHSLAIFTAEAGIARNSAVGISFSPFNRRENRRSLASFDHKEIAHLGAFKIARFCGGAVKNAAATAENRAILVHSPMCGSWALLWESLWIKFRDSRALCLSALWHSRPHGREVELETAATVLVQASLDALAPTNPSIF